MRTVERRLTAKLVNFFDATAPRVSREIYARILRDRAKALKLEDWKAIDAGLVAKHSEDQSRIDKASDGRVRRDAFLYMDPMGDFDEFAQCGTCGLFRPGEESCATVVGRIVAAGSCGNYAYGTPADGQPQRAELSQAEVGYVVRPVRCENCGFFDDKGCGLYRDLNDALPEVFDLDAAVHPKGCCNAQTPMSEARKSIFNIGPTMSPDFLGVDDELPTVTQVDADYVPYPVGGERCNGCMMFRSPGRCTLVEGPIASEGHCVFWQAKGAQKSSDHPGGADLHVEPQNATPIQGIPVADVVTRANIQHVSWEMVREGKYDPKPLRLAMSDLIATQQVVDRQRVAIHEAQLLVDGGEVEPKSPPIVILWDGDYFILGGHHGLQAAYNMGVNAVDVLLLVAPT